jgi:hypothetical protein
MKGKKKMKKLILSVMVGVVSFAGLSIYFAAPKAWSDVNSLPTKTGNKATDILSMYNASNMQSGINWTQFVYETVNAINWQSLGYTNPTINWTTLYKGN